MESQDVKRFDELTETTPAPQMEQEGKKEEEDEKDEVKPVPIDTFKENDERPEPEPKTVHEAGQSEADAAPSAFDAGIEEEVEEEEDVSTSSSRQPSSREEGEGQVEDGEAAEGGITIAPRTPVLDQDPLRALASSPGTTAPMSPFSTTHTPIPIAQPSETTSRGKIGAEGGLSPSGGRKKPVLEVDDMEGLKTLMRAGWWRDAARLAEKLSSRSRWPHERLQYKLCVLVSLIKTRQFKRAAEELESLGDLEAASTFYEHYPHLYQDKRGSMVPFTLFILRAELPSYISPEGLSRSLDALFVLLDTCRTQLQRLTSKSSAGTDSTAAVESASSTLTSDDLDALSSLSISRSSASPLNHASFADDLDQDVIQTWRGREVRVLFSISTRYVQAGDYAAALRILTSLVQIYPKDIILLSAVGRLMLQWGNLTGAERYFREVEQLADSSRMATVMMNRGLEYIGRDRFSDALRAFESVLETEPDNVWAANNRAVCWLYLRDLQRAVSSLEQLVAANPEANLTDVVVFNLCTLYDLESDSSMNKKKGLLAVISQFASDDFDTSIIKVPV